MVIPSSVCEEYITGMPHRNYVSGVVVHAMSANAFVEDEKQSIEAGMNGHLSKPIDSKKLLEVLNQVFADK